MPARAHPRAVHHTLAPGPFWYDPEFAKQGSGYAPTTRPKTDREIKTQETEEGRLGTRTHEVRRKKMQVASAL